MVDFQQTGLSFVEDVQPGIIYPLVLYLAQHFHLLFPQALAVDPSGGFTQPTTRFALGPLHQVNLADIREELDRISAHIDSAHALIAAGSPCGRKLDFLTQEFNREANTLCSKAADSQLTRLGLDLKAVVDRLREQVQNVE